MPSTDQYFTRFNQAIDGYSLPERFTYPFFYQPDPLCIIAAKQLQQHLSDQTVWHHDFNETGKMFGVLLVQNLQGELGYLSAFSGTVADKNLLPGFVPPIFDMLLKDRYFIEELNEITSVNNQVNALASNPDIAKLQQTLLVSQQDFDQALCQQQQLMVISRKSRKLQRAQGLIDLNVEQLAVLNQQLARQSIEQKNALRDLKLNLQQQLAQIQQQLTRLTELLKSLRQLKKSLSASLQHKVFEQYQCLNSSGIARDLNDIFKGLPLPIPPVGSGECAAPKLLQFAFKHGFRPLALAEFWWGAPPKSEIRQHLNYYPSCTSKCQPILNHMLAGMALDPNPLQIHDPETKELEIIYQDEAMLVINKPHDLLSVPGKLIQDSVYSRIKEQFPDATGPLIVHRLDMATSGLMLIALSQRANKSLTKQFRTRTIEKSYVALIEGELLQTEGIIELPLRGDLYDRPRQLICFEHGKSAYTSWLVLAVTKGRTKLRLKPKTGRTHQLRVHCAHEKGLGMPIVGDCLYGQRDKRLHLHAQSIRFEHPYTKAEMYFEVDSDF